MGGDGRWIVGVRTRNNWGQLFYSGRTLGASTSSYEVVQFFDAGIYAAFAHRTSPETKFGERSSDAVQAYARVRAEHGKRRGQPSPEFSLNARIPTLPNCVQEGDFNLASTAFVKLHDLLFRRTPPEPSMQIRPEGPSSLAWRGNPEAVFQDRRVGRLDSAAEAGVALL